MSTEVITITNRERMNWLTALVFGLFHIGAVAALFMFSWRSLFISLALYWMTICFGISLGYHRLHTHKVVIGCRCSWNTFSPSAAL